MRTCMHTYARTHMCTCTHMHIMHTSIHTHTCTHTHAYACMHMHTCMDLGKRTMPDGNPLASALGEDPFIPLLPERASQNKLSPFIPESTRKSNSRPPSWRTHSITMRVGPGGEHTYSIRIVRSGRPVPSGRIPAREGVVRLGAQCLLVPAARPRTLIKVSRSWR